MDDAHLYKDPAKLEACVWFIYTTLPIPARALQRASARELRWWLTLPAPVAEVVAERAKAHSNPLTHEALPELLRAACSAAGAAGKRVDVDEVMLRFAPEAECEEYLREAEMMISVLLPRTDLQLGTPLDCPQFITKERLRLCWEQVTQIRGLLAQTYCRPHKGNTHPYDSHPMQYACALLHFTLKMATQYREPNPYARKLAAHALERLATYLTTWLDSGDVDTPRPSNDPGVPLPRSIRLHSVAYGPGQRLCFARGEHWREALVLRPPDATHPHHLLRLHIGPETHEEEIDLDAHSHSAMPLYAYAVGCPLRLLSPRGAWEECIIVYRAPNSNQHVVRMPPVGHLHWTILVPWNHVAMPLHSRVPLFGVRPHVAANWQPPEASPVAIGLEAAGGGEDGADFLERKADDDLDENNASPVELGRVVEFVLNIRAASRSWRSWRALWCPGVVVAIHKKPTRSTALAGVSLSKTCDLAAGGYCFDPAWCPPDQPLLVRELLAPAAVGETAAAAAAAADAGSLAVTIATANGDAVGPTASPGPDTDDEAEAEMELEAELMETELMDPDLAVGGMSGMLQRRIDSLAHRVAGALWGPWERALVHGDDVELDSETRPADADPIRLRWRHNLRIEIDVQPLYHYLPGSDLRILRNGAEWVTSRIISTHTGAEAAPNTYILGGIDGAPREAIELSPLNHAPLLDTNVDLEKEHLRYAGWVRSTYAHVVDALSGERLDIMLQCVKLRVDGTSGVMENDAFDTVARLTFDEYIRPLIVVGDAASGKSTFARLFLVLCIQQRREPQLVPYLLSTIDLVRIIKQNSLGGDYLDGYLRCVYGPRSRRYLYLKQAMLERRLVLFLDGMDEVPTGLKSVIEAYVMCFLRANVKIVMTSRPGGFSHAWLELCTRVNILPLDVEQQESIAKARLRQPQHLHLFKQLMVRPDLQQLASNPLILSMFIAHIRSASKSQASDKSGLLNRWKLYHAAMTTIITRLDAKTLEARKGQAGRSSAAYMNLLQEIAFHAHCKQMKDLNLEVLRSAITEQTSALWDDVKESVARGQFAVLTAFVENDETIYRFGHLTFQEHLCSMMINRMLGEELERIKSIMASSGLRKMLQGSWWLTVTQFCLEGLTCEGPSGVQLARRFADTMLDDVTDSQGVVRVAHAEVHSYDSMAAFSALFKHSSGTTALEVGDGKTDVNAEWLPQLCAGVSGHATLQRLSLKRMMVNAATPSAAHAGLHGLSAVLRDSPALVALQLVSCGLESRHLLPLCAELKESPVRLKELDLSGNKIADEGLVALSNILAVRGIALEKLDISGNALEEGGVSALARALSSSSWVQTVQLASHPLPVQQLKAGGRVEVDGQKLTDFDLQFILEVISSGARARAEAGNGDAAAASPAPSSKPATSGATNGVIMNGHAEGGNGSMHANGEGNDPVVTVAIPSMSLGYNAITDKGATLLASMIASGALTVARLNLRGNKIGREGAVALLDGLMRSDCPCELLDLSDNGICGLTAEGDGKYSMEAVAAACRWLKKPGNPLRSLKLGQNQLCGVNWKGRGEYTSVAVEAICDALVSDACQLQDLRIFGNCWGNKDAHKLADALKLRSKPLAMLDMRWNEMGSDAVEALLAAATPTCNVEHLPQRLRCGATLNAHTNWVETLQHDNEYMYSGSQDMTIRKWRRSDLHCEAVLKGHEKGVLSLKLLGDMLYAGDRKGEIKLWKVGPGEDQHTCKGTLLGHKGAIWMLQYDDEIGRLYSCCDDKKVICWDVAQLRQVKVFDGHKDKVYREVLFLDDRLTPEGGMLFAGDSTGAIYQWDIAAKELIQSWRGHEGSVWGMLMSTFALISGGLDGMVKLWDPRTRDLIRQLYKHNSSVCSFSVQANVFYSCAVDNIIKVWDWKDGTCLGTMHGHRETVANLCLTPEGTLFSSGIDKMVKVWKPPGSWGEEWHGLRDLDLTTAGMVAEDVDRLEKQMRGEAAKWVSLSVSNNYLYDEGIGKLVNVLRNTTAPLELLDLSKTNMTSVGAKMVAQLLSSEDGPSALPLKKLVLHSNDIDAAGYAAIGAAVRGDKCGLKEIVVSTHTKEAKSGSRKTVVTTEHNSIRVEEVKTMVEMRQDFLGDAELMVLAEMLQVNTTLALIQLKKNAVGDDGALALGGALGTAHMPVRALRLYGNHVSAEGAQALVEGLMTGACPVEEISIVDNPVCLSSTVVRKYKTDQEREAELKKLANISRATPASEWAKVQLQTRMALAERQQQGVPRTALRQDDFLAVLRLPKELRQDRWQELGGLYGWTRRPSNVGELPSARELPEKMMLPLPRQLSKLTAEQLQQLWELVVEPQPLGAVVYRVGAVSAIVKLLQSPSNRLHTLDLSGVALCGLDANGKPKLNGEYRADGVDLLCLALRSENCVLKILRLKHSKMREAEAKKLAAALRPPPNSRRVQTLEALVVEEFILPVPTLLGTAAAEYEASRGVISLKGSGAHPVRLDNDKHALMAVELRVLVDLLEENDHLEELCFTGARVRDHLRWLSNVIVNGRLPLLKLLLADNGISVAQGVHLIEALQVGAPQLQMLSLSMNPVCGVEDVIDGGRDEYDISCIEALCEWLQGGRERAEGGEVAAGRRSQLTELHLVDVALCGRAKDGNGTYSAEAMSSLIGLLSSGSCSLRDLDITGSGMQEEEAHALGRGLQKNSSLRVLKADRMVLEPQALLRGDTLDVEGEVFSELDAMLMVQLLVHNTNLTRIDLSGTRPLPREIKLLSDGFARCKFPLRELSVNGRALGLESCASLLEPLRHCPLEVLELRKNDMCGVKATGREPFSTYVLKIVCELIARPGGGLLKLSLQENHLLGNDVYSSEAVTLLIEALKSPHCRLEELHLGLINQQHGMHERDASVLGEAVRTCTSLKALSITGALLPMAELLNSTICLDLAGKGLGRVEMGIAAQLLHKNSLLQVLKLSDNPIGQFGMEALADAIMHSKPPLVEVHLGNLGIRSGQQIQRFLIALRSYRAPLRVLDLHRNCLLPPLGEDVVDPQAWLASTPETDDFNEWCDTTLAALAEVCNWMETPGNVLSRAVLSHTMEMPTEATSRRSVGAVLEALRNLAVRRLCAALGSPHCVLTDIALHEFGFSPENVELLAPPLRRPECTLASLRLSDWAMNPHQLLDEHGALTFGKVEGRATDAVLACALLSEQAGSPVQAISLEYIGSRLERSGFAAVCTLIGSGGLTSLHTLSLRHASWLTKKQIVTLLRAVERGGCQLEEVVLAQTHLCVTAFGHYSIDAVQAICEMLMADGNRVRKLDLRGTCLCGTPQDTTTGYTLVGVETLCRALEHPSCQVVEIDLSENGIRAERDEPAPSLLPPSLYGITKRDTAQLAALHPDVRMAVLKLLDYPAVFKEAAQRKGQMLPSLETLSRMAAAEMSQVWEQALQAEASLDASAQPPAAGPARAPVAGELAGGSSSGALAEVAGAPRGAITADADANDELAAAIALSMAPAASDTGAYQAHEHYERGYPPIRRPSEGGPHTSLMAKHLTPDIYDELKEVRTAAGFSIDDVIRVGVRLPTHPVGLLAGDSECYETFPALFDAVVHEWHGWHRSQSPSHKTDTDASKLEIPREWPELAGRVLLSTRIDVRRNFVGWMFTPSLNAAGRAGVERAGQALFEQLGDEQQGEYFSFGSLDETMSARLHSEGVHFVPPDAAHLHAGAGAAPYTSDLREWSDHRGVYRSTNGELAVMVNEEDHLRIVVRKQSTDLFAAFGSICTALAALDRSHAATAGIASSPRRGALTVSPTNLGTGMRVTLRLRLPHLGKDHVALEAVCSQLLRQATNSDAIVRAVPPEGFGAALDGGASGLFDVSTRASVGVSEVALLQSAVDLTLKLSELEGRLADGLTLLEAMTPPPPSEAAPIQLGRAARLSESLQILQFSGRPLRVRDWGGGSEALVLTGLLPSQDASTLAHLLQHHRALRCLDVSSCRLTSAISLELVGALGASLLATQPPLLTELRLAGNRVRTSGALVLIDALVASRCQLEVLDLSSSELCGGTVSLPRLFGDLRASTVRVGEEGHSATLTSDGLCSVGPLMERGSGSYHAELLVRQATDADGAYVGIVTPLAKLSSYPGADAHSVGWRAKGGLRHKHGSAIEAASLAWGQGDRVGLRLDTDACSLTLYKNGETLTTNQLLPVSFGEAGARFCIGRYYGTVEMSCVSMSRIGGSQSIDFTALSALCSRIVAHSALRILSLAHNQIAGVDSVGGGERKAQGVDELLTVLRSGVCMLEELDLSGNLFSTADAHALLHAALTPSVRGGVVAQHLKLNTWLIPVQLLAAGSTAALGLAASSIGAADAQLLATTIRERSSLQPTIVDLSSNPLGGEGALAIVKALADRRVPLEQLRLVNVGLRAESGVAVLTELARMPSLAVLDLSNNPLTADPPKGGPPKSTVGGLSPRERPTDTHDATRASTCLDALRALLAVDVNQLRVVRLNHCELCSAGGDAPADKGASSTAAGVRHEARAASSVAALVLAISEVRVPLRELSLAGNRFRDTEAASLHEAAREQNAELDDKDEEHLPFELTFEEREPAFTVSIT